MNSVDHQAQPVKLQTATDHAFTAAFFFLPLSKPLLFVSLFVAFSLMLASGSVMRAWPSLRKLPWVMPAAILAALPYLTFPVHGGSIRMADFGLGYYWFFALMVFFAASQIPIVRWLRAFVAAVFIAFCYSQLMTRGWLPQNDAPAALANYILYSQFLAVGIVLLAILYRNEMRRTVRWAYLALIGLFFFGLATGDGRSGMLVLVVLLPFIAGQIFFRQSRLRILLACMLAVAALLMSPKVQDRIEIAFTDLQMLRSNVTETSLGYRFEMWQTALQVVREHPLLGAGPSGFYRAWHSTPRTGEGIGFVEPHNAFLFYASSYGIVGLAVLIWLYLALLWTGWKHRQSMEGGIAFAVAVICIVGSLTNTMFRGTVSHAWMMLFIGLQGSLLYRQYRKDA